MDKYRVIFVRSAKDDIIQIGIYISYTLRAVDASNQLIKGLYKSISQLSYFLYKFPVVKSNKLKKAIIRYMPYKNYMVFYEIVDKEKIVKILRIVYKQRNWKDFI